MTKDQSMKIMVFNGSPKREASDTLHLTRAFVDGMNDIQENRVHTIHVVDRHIEFCTGCFTCKRNGGACIHHDDMQEILEEILDSDVLIFSFPLYCYGMPAPLKALIDRTMPLSSMAMEKVGDRYVHTAQRDFSKLRYVMICGCGFPNSNNNFEAMALQFNMMFGADAAILTVPEAPMFNAPEAEPVTKPFLETVQQAGREYAQSGQISPETMEKLAVPMIPQEVYAAIVNGGMS
nr:flavodoxin family protein [bacterium]